MTFPGQPRLWAASLTQNNENYFPAALLSICAILYTYQTDGSRLFSCCLFAVTHKMSGHIISISFGLDCFVLHPWFCVHIRELVCNLRLPTTCWWFSFTPWRQYEATLPFYGSAEGKDLKVVIFFRPHSSNTHQGFIGYPWSEILDGTLVKVGLVKPSFSQPSPTFDLSSNRAKVSVSSLWGIAFPPLQPPAALLSLAGKFSKGDGECDWGVSSWHLWITKIAGAAGGATASNGSLIFLDVERRDPVRDSPQLEKAHFAQVDSAKVMDRLSHQNWYESNLEQRWIYIFFPSMPFNWERRCYLWLCYDDRIRKQHLRMM